MKEFTGNTYKCINICAEEITWTLRGMPELFRMKNRYPINGYTTYKQANHNIGCHSGVEESAFGREVTRARGLPPASRSPASTQSRPHNWPRPRAIPHLPPLPRQQTHPLPLPYPRSHPANTPTVPSPTYPPRQAHNTTHTHLTSPKVFTTIFSITFDCLSGIPLPPPLLVRTQRVYMRACLRRYYRR